MEKSSQQRSFDLPHDLSWGSQKILKCMNDANSVPAMPGVGDDESSDTDEYYNNHDVDYPVEKFQSLSCGKSVDVPHGRMPPTDSDKRTKSRVADEISATREKLMMEYKTDIRRLRERIRKNKSSDEEIPPIKVTRSRFTCEQTHLPVNSKSKVNMGPPPPRQPLAGGINAEVDDRRSEKKSMRLMRRNLEKQEERLKFAVSLSRKEIEEDFITMTGKKPPRKPNKHPKNVQIELNALFPGSRLFEVHPDRYKVNENEKN